MTIVMTAKTRRRERRRLERLTAVDADLRVQIPPEEWETLTLQEQAWVSARYREIPSNTPDAVRIAMGLLRFVKTTQKRDCR